MLELAPLPADFAATRDGLAQIVTHVMARRRDAATGRFGMRVGPGSIASPMFADEVLRLNATTLLRERHVGDRPETKSIASSGVTLAELAAFAEVDLDASFSVGTDTPPLVDVAAPLRIELRFGLDWELQVRLLKRKGPTHEDRITLRSVPGGLESIITPRLRQPSALIEVERTLAKSDAIDEFVGFVRLPGRGINSSRLGS